MSSDRKHRLGALRRFAVAITVLNVLGHTVFGFEQSWLQPIIALAVAYSVEVLVEFVDARGTGRIPRYHGGTINKIDFLLSAHISGLAVAMLLYANDRLLPIAFASAVAVGSKALLRAQTPEGSRHFFNPSNFGISFTLVLFPWVGIAPPYHFTENLSGAGDWILPGVIVTLGSFLNTRFTKRIPLISAWLCGFALQAILRTAFLDGELAAALGPMTSTAFLLFTFYMITDPATTPIHMRGQISFGLATAAAYGLLTGLHVVFGLFFALSIVCLGRGGWLIASYWAAALQARPAPVPIGLSRDQPVLLGSGVTGANTK